MQQIYSLGLQRAVVAAPEPRWTHAEDVTRWRQRGRLSVKSSDLLIVRGEGPALAYMPR
jgi:hypothetical protein